MPDKLRLALVSNEVYFSEFVQSCAKILVGHGFETSVLSESVGDKLEGLSVSAAHVGVGAEDLALRGIEITPETLSIETMRDVVFGAGHFLGHEQTLSIMQSEYTYPLVGDRNSPDDWVDAGAKNVKERAHEYVTRTLAAHHPDHDPDSARAAIKEAFPLALDR